MTKGIGRVLRQIIEDYLSTGDGRNFVDRVHSELGDWLRPKLWAHWEYSFDDPEYFISGALQHAAYKLRQALDSGTNIEKLPNYCKSAVWNHLIDEKRKTSRRGDGQTESIGDDTPRHRELADPRAEIAVFLRGRTLKALLRKIPEECRELLQQLYVESKKGAQVAKERGVSPQAVSKQHRHCIELLQQEAGEYREYLDS